MQNSSTEPTQGTYLCRSCQKFFTSDIQLSVECPHCKSKQLHLESWDLIKKKRERFLNFSTAKTVEYGIINTSGHDAKLNIIENKKAKRRIMMILIGFIWLAGIGILAYKSSTKETINAHNSTQSPALEKFQQNQQQILAQAFPVIQTFFSLEKAENKSHLTHLTSEDQLYSDFNNPTTDYLKGISHVQAVQDKGSFCEFLIIRKQGNPFEVIMARQEDSWLIDWEHFSNASSMPFREFLTKKPTEAQTFRLYFTVDSVADSQELTFIEAQPNNNLFSPNQAKHLRIKFTSDHPLRAHIDNLISHSKDFKNYNNSSLEVHQQSLTGLIDPKGYYRVNITLKYTNKDGRLRPEVLSINAAHWLGSHWKDTFSPAQKLTRRAP